MKKIRIGLVAAFTVASFVIAEATPLVLATPESFQQIKPPPPPPDPLHLFSKKGKAPARPKRKKIRFPKVKLPPRPTPPGGAPPRPF